MSLFSGMSQGQIVSSVVMIGLFTLWTVLIALALTAFYVTSRPRGGRVRSVAAWQLVALLWFFWADVAMVWSAPAENAFVTPSGGFFDPAVFNIFSEAGHYQKSLTMFLSVLFAVLGVISMMIGLAMSRARERREHEAALAV